MKNLLIVIASLILIFPFGLFGGIVNQNNDFQIWCYQALNKHLTKCSRLYLEGEIRYGDNASTLYLAYLQSRLLFEVCPNLEVAPGYRQLYTLRSSDRKWVPIYEPLVDVFLKRHLNGWKFSDRNRTSYLFLKDEPNAWQYRNRLMVHSPWKLGKMQLNPLVFDEVFFRERRGFFENRFGVGGEVPVGEKSKMTVVYMLRHIDIEDSWRQNNVVWFLIDFSF